VWDLRAKKPWCEFRADTAVNSMVWNPSQGLHMMTGGESSLKLWDLRASTSMPLTTLENSGILSLDWCPFDDTLLLSCGKDNTTKLWDLYSLRVVAEIPNQDSSSFDAAAGANAELYGGGLGSSQQKRYDVQWSPIRRGVVSTCSFDRKVQIHSVTGLAAKAGRPPKWMSPPCGVSTGFGGTIVSIHSKCIKIDNVVEHPELVEASTQFENQFNTQECISYCQFMAEKSFDEYERHVWNFMQIMFETNAREQLLEYLGFDPEKIHQQAMEFENEGDVNPDESPTMSREAESAIQNALLVGNFEAAVECCFRSNNLADALVLASCGGAELWAKTQSEYFAREAAKRPYLSLVSAVVHDQLVDLVKISDPAKWKETLAMVSTYGKSEEFPSLCAALGDRLEEAGEMANASLCYMCALNLGQTVKYWKCVLQNTSKAGGGMNLLSLHAFIEKVAVFNQALDSSSEMDDETANLFAEYSNALANQGLFVAAAKYLRLAAIRYSYLCVDLQYANMSFIAEVTHRNAKSSGIEFIAVGWANSVQISEPHLQNFLMTLSMSVLPVTCMVLLLRMVQIWCSKFL
jgi:protein transport protein SEC31